MMHSLFWKIFVSFWVALVLFAAGTVAVTSILLEAQRAQQDETHPRARITGYVDEARSVARREGIEGLKPWLAQLDRRELIPFVLLDTQGNDLLGRAVPPGVHERFARRPAHGMPGRGPHFRRLTIELPDGSVYRLVPDFQSVTLGRVLKRPRIAAVPLLLGALVSAVVVFLLARYLLAPVTRLRHAAEKIAEGDLDQRVGPALGKRRDEIAQLAASFDHMAARLQSLLGSQQQLLRDVSHELRSPLARLQVALGLARQRATPEVGGELDRIEREADRLNELIAQLLSLSRMESGTSLAQRETVDLAALLTDVVADAAFEARSDGRDAMLRELPALQIEGDPATLHSAFENILRNAVRYTAEGTAVEVDMQRCAGDKERVCISVRDYGPGVPDELLERLFDPFVRVEQARERARGGYGLGLAIAERAVRLHGGRVSARNASGGGLEILVELPCATREDA